LLISYRRDDSAPWAGRLRDALRSAFGSGNVFLDFDSIPSGASFAERISTAISGADAVLVLIGPRWLDVRTPDGARRLDDPHDSVAVEVRQALGAGKPVVPVLVGGAAMPSAEALPAELRPLAGLNAAEVSDRRWDHDVDCLITDLAGKRRGRRRIAVAAAGVAVLVAAAALAVARPWASSTKAFASVGVPFTFDYPKAWIGPLAAGNDTIYVGVDKGIGGEVENGIFVKRTATELASLEPHTGMRRYRATSRHGIPLAVEDYLLGGSGGLHERDYAFSVTGQKWVFSCAWYAEQRAAVADACARAATSLRPSD
jgi:hypothetical protein